jgi:uncharacterized protein (TIGR03067 family)
MQSMTRILFGLLVFTLTAFAPAPLPKREPKVNDSVAVANLLGGWKATRLLSAGSNTPQDPKSNGVQHVTITPTQWIFNKPQNAPVEYDLKIDHTKKPAEINFYNKGQGTGGSPYGTGIIRRDGNQIRIVYTWGGKRPMNFDEPPSSGWDLTLQRE